MPQPSRRPGKGAVPYDGGVTFRTWAKFAEAVYVRGDFNNWQLTHALAPEGDGWWSCDVAYAKAGDKYRFAVSPAGDKIDPYARMVEPSAREAIIVDDDFPWQCHDFVMPPWHELVIYEMHVGSYPDEPVAPHRMLDAILADEEIGHLKDLGVNAVELMAAGQLSGDESWGYNPSYIYAVESAYGGPHALKRFVDRLHAHGIAVLLDVVYHHLGPSELSIWRYDGWGEFYEPFRNCRGHGDGDAEMGGIYFYNDWRADTPWGHKNRPDYGRPEVREYLRDNALMWLQEYRLDGLHLDATHYIRNVRGWNHVPPDDPTCLGGWGWNLLCWINDSVRDSHPWKITIAEDRQGDESLTRPTSEGGAGFGSQWDRRFVQSVREVLQQPFDHDRDLEKIRSAVEYRPHGWATQRVIYTESHHDVARGFGKRRLPDLIWPGNAEGWMAKKRSMLGAVLVFTSPGIPMVFQGQEVFEIKPFDPHARPSPIDWDRRERYQGIYALYRDLIRLRRNWFDHTAGLRGHGVRVFHAYPGSKVLAFHRWEQGGPGDDVVVVLNFENRAYPHYTIGFPRPGRWKMRLNTDGRCYDDSFGDYGVGSACARPSRHGFDGYPYQGDVALAPYSALILSQDR
jgi:1,4-alpha-glucan branching enzyme